MFLGYSADHIVIVILDYLKNANWTGGHAWSIAPDTLIRIDAYVIFAGTVFVTVMGNHGILLVKIYFLRFFS